MFVEINGDLVNTNAVARATFVAQHEVDEGKKPARIEPARLTIQYTGGQPSAHSFQGPDAERLWADLRRHVRPPALLETK